MKNLFFVIDKEVYDDGETLNGNKNISLYEIIDNKPKLMAEIETTLEHNSVKEIEFWLEENEEIEDYDLTQL